MTMTAPGPTGYVTARNDLEMAQALRLSFWSVLRYRMRLLLSDGTFEVAEVGNAAVGILWGALTLNPYADTFGSAPSFRTLALLAPEWVIGLIVLVGGIQAMAALFHGNLLWRQIATLLGCSTWIFFGGMFMVANPAGLALALYLPLAAFAAWAYLRLTLRRNVLWADSRSTP